MMLPTTRVTANKARFDGITPDQLSAPTDALNDARRSALLALLAARPTDALAENWKKVLAELAQDPIGGTAK